LFAAPVLSITSESSSRAASLSPDVGSTKIGRAFAKRLDVDLAIVDKRRSEKDNVDVMNVIGDVRGRDVVILDDMITTGGTLVKAARAVQEKGATSVVACATHAVLAGDACRLIMDSPIRGGRRSLPFDAWPSAKAKSSTCRADRGSVNDSLQRIGQYSVRVKVPGRMPGFEFNKGDRPWNVSASMEPRDGMGWGIARQLRRSRLPAVAATAPGLSLSIR
jgi:hypothetical protein